MFVVSAAWQLIDTLVFSIFLPLRLALTSSDFLHHRDDNWCATIALHNNEISLYENFWTDLQHYICQYDSEYI